VSLPIKTLSPSVYPHVGVCSFRSETGPDRDRLKPDGPNRSSSVWSSVQDFPEFRLSPVPGWMDGGAIVRDVHHGQTVAHSVSKPETGNFALTLDPYLPFFFASSVRPTLQLPPTTHPAIASLTLYPARPVSTPSPSALSALVRPCPSCHCSACALKLRGHSRAFWHSQTMPISQDKVGPDRSGRVRDRSGTGQVLGLPLPLISIFGSGRSDPVLDRCTSLPPWLIEAHPLLSRSF